MDLQGLRVLITRPAGRADDLLHAIATAGGSAAHIPLLTVIPLDSQRDASVVQHTNDCLRNLTRYRRVIAISINAVHYGMQWLDGCVPAPQRPAHIEWYGIGAASIAEFAKWGIDARGGSSGATSEALLALPDLQNVCGEALLILRGVGGRETLAAVLRERGATVDYAEFYRRSIAPLDDRQRQLLQRAEFDAVCVNSAETLDNLWQHLSAESDLAAAPSSSAARYRQIALLVPSARVAQLADELGFSRVVVAANAGTAATLAALRGLNALRSAN